MRDRGAIGSVGLFEKILGREVPTTDLISQPPRNHPILFALEFSIVFRDAEKVIRDESTSQGITVGDKNGNQDRYLRKEILDYRHDVWES